MAPQEPRWHRVVREQVAVLVAKVALAEQQQLAPEALVATVDLVDPVVMVELVSPDRL